MRIDGYNTASEVMTGQSTHGINSGEHATKETASEDRATLSADSVSISSLAVKALANPAVRQDKVEALRQAISGGQYQLDPEKIAGSMVDETA